MMDIAVSVMDLKILQDAFGDRIELDVPLRRYTAARLGGPAEALLTVHSVQEMVEAVELAW